MSNTRIWDRLGKTDPAATKPFKRGGGFSGTAIKPIWAERRMTEEFGPCGIGWGMDEPTFQVVPGHNQEVLVYCTVAMWYNEFREAEGTRTAGLEGSQRVYGVGGDKVVSYIKANEQYGRPERWENDDEAFKKAYTDALTNAMKHIGVGADVHMGQFDDSKYVAQMRDEFAQEAPKPPPQKPKQKTVAERKAIWAQLMDDLKGEAPKGWQKMVAYMQHPDTLGAIEDLGDYAEQFKNEARELTRLVKAGEEAAGEPVAKAMSRVGYNFDTLQPNEPDNLEKALGEGE